MSPDEPTHKDGRPFRSELSVKEAQKLVAIIDEMHGLLTERGKAAETRGNG